MHITDSLIAYDTGFTGYSSAHTAVSGGTFTGGFQLVGAHRLTGDGIGVVDQTTGELSFNDVFQIRMYRINAGPNVGDSLGVSGAAGLSIDAGSSSAARYLSSCQVRGTDQVQIVTNNPLVNNGCYLYNYSFSGTPSKTSSVVMEAGTGIILREWVGCPIVSLTSSVSVALPNFGHFVDGILSIAFQWAEGFYVINSGTPAAITNVAAWHTTASSDVLTGPGYGIIDAARLTDSTFVVFATTGYPSGGTEVGYLMQMSVGGSVLSQTTVPSSFLDGSAGFPAVFSPHFQRGIDGALYLTYATERGNPYPWGSTFLPLDSSTGQPTGGARNVVPDDFVVLAAASPIAAGQWFAQSRQRVFMSQQSTTDWVAPGSAAGSFATYVDPSFWGASLDHNFPTPPDLTPAGSVIGINPGWNGSTEPDELTDSYSAIFAKTADTAVCIAPDYTPGGTVYEGRAHSVFRVATDALYRPTPPTIITPYAGTMTPDFPDGPPVQLGGPTQFQASSAFSSVGSFVYQHGVPSVSPTGNTFRIGIFGAEFNRNLLSGVPSLVDTDQLSPYVITTASVNGLGQNVYTQRFEIQTDHLVGFGTVNVYSEPLYTWRGGRMTWTYVRAAIIEVDDVYVEIVVLTPFLTSGWSIGAIRIG